MKKLVFLATLVLASLAFAGTKGVYNQAVNGTVSVTAIEPSTAFVYNAGTNVIYASFGGHSVASTNDATTYFANRMPIRPGASYTTAMRFSLVSIYCATNGLVDVSFEGAE